MTYGSTETHKQRVTETFWTLDYFKPSLKVAVIEHHHRHGSSSCKYNTILTIKQVTDILYHLLRFFCWKILQCTLQCAHCNACHKRSLSVIPSLPIHTNLYTNTHVLRMKRYKIRVSAIFHKKRTKATAKYTQHKQLTLPHRQ